MKDSDELQPPKSGYQGSCTFSIIATKPWPPTSEGLVFQQEFGDPQLLKISVTLEGRLVLELYQNGTRCHSLQTPKIVRFEDAEIKVVVGWDSDSASLAAAGKLLISSNKPCKYVGDELVIKPKIEVYDSEFGKILEQKSAEAKKARKRRERDRTAPADKRLRNVDENVANLHIHAAALWEMINLAGRDEKFWILPSIASALRMLISNGGSNKPLLQIVAGQLNKGLEVYCPDPREENDKIGEIRALLSASSFCLTEKFRGSYKLDLDVWLDFQGYNYDGLKITNNDLIKKIAESSGAHYDPIVSPVIDSILQEKSVRNSFREEFLLRTSLVVVKLASSLIQTRKMQLQT